jgi:uncharacterized protein YraI
VPPTAPPSATAAPTASPKPVLKANDLANVRSGPGATFKKLGQLEAGQEATITGKNADGDWWQVDFKGTSAWVAASMVTANDAANGVEVVESAAAPAPVAQAPRAAPQPQAQPQPQPAAPAQPAPTAPPAYQYTAAGAEYAYKDNDPLTIRCRVWDNATARNPQLGTIKITGPNAPGPVKFQAISEMVNTGFAANNQYVSNVGCKIEMPWTAGAYTAQLIDDGGNPQSDLIQFSPAADMRQVILTWVKR